MAKGDVELTVTEETLETAFYSIWRVAAGKLSDEEIRQCISEMLNDGLRIREVVKEEVHGKG